MFEPGKPIVTLTDAAATQARGLVEAAESDIIGLRIGIKTAGCSGLQYDVQYACKYTNMFICMYDVYMYMHACMHA